MNIKDFLSRLSDSNQQLLINNPHDIREMLPILNAHQIFCIIRDKKYLCEVPFESSDYDDESKLKFILDELEILQLPWQIFDFNKLAPSKQYNTLGIYFNNI
jgi:hypothetical protein